MALLPLDFLYRYGVLFLLKMALLTLDIFAQNVLHVTTEMSSVLNQKWHYCPGIRSEQKVASFGSSKWCHFWL